MPLAEIMRSACCMLMVGLHRRPVALSTARTACGWDVTSPHANVASMAHEWRHSLEAMPLLRCSALTHSCVIQLTQPPPGSYQNVVENAWPTSTPPILAVTRKQVSRSNKHCSRSFAADSLTRAPGLGPRCPQVPYWLLKSWAHACSWSSLTPHAAIVVYTTEPIFSRPWSCVPLGPTELLGVHQRSQQRGPCWPWVCSGHAPLLHGALHAAGLVFALHLPWVQALCPILIYTASMCVIATSQ
mmetsp:Transcript_7534/g.18679  ORF Transcript_7534/g.18679 Transcript_7534/m.18679 type:complete len:243 (+) Transcript_7534:544-1272(+)